MALTVLERKILGAIQSGLPLSPRPYEELSKSIGIPENQLLDTLREWKAQGKIRRVGAIVSHFQMGRGGGAMVIWQVPEKKTDTVGKLFASFPDISHAYLRPVAVHWPYNLYTMVHARGDHELEEMIQAMSRQSGLTEFRVLRTIRELKKVPPVYITEC